MNVLHTHFSFNSDFDLVQSCHIDADDGDVLNHTLHFRCTPENYIFLFLIYINLTFTNLVFKCVEFFLFFENFFDNCDVSFVPNFCSCYERCMILVVILEWVWVDNIFWRFFNSQFFVLQFRIFFFLQMDWIIIGHILLLDYVSHENDSSREYFFIVMIHNFDDQHQIYV